MARTQQHDDPIDDIGEDAAVETVSEAQPIKGEADPRQWVSRLTVATMRGNPGRVKSAQGRIQVVRVIGRANGTKIVKSDKSPDGYFIAAIGEFEGVNMETGEVFASGVTYFPGGLHEAVIARLEELGEGASIEYAIQIDAVPANNPIGYSYISKSLLPPEQVDSLAQLRNRAQALLPAPVRQLTGPQQAIVQQEATRAVPGLSA